MSATFINKRDLAAVCIVALLAGGILVGMPRRQDKAGRWAANKLERGPFLPAVLVEVDWLREHRGNGQLLVIDARSHQQYEQGHIEGAVHVSLEMLQNGTHDHGKLDSVVAVQQLLGQAGVDGSQTVVVYGDADYRSAARLFWILESHGVRSVAVLNGGIGSWVEAGCELTREATIPRPRAFVATVDPSRLATKRNVIVAMSQDDVAILDSRSHAEYIGIEGSTERLGHVPSAINLEYVGNLDVDGTACRMKRPDELSELYSRLIPNGTGRVITYCTHGSRASVSYLALRHAGIPVSLYDGAWAEWSSDASLPIETVTRNLVEQQP